MQKFNVGMVASALRPRQSFSRAGRCLRSGHAGQRG